jgi:hypothetical protein
MRKILFFLFLLFAASLNSTAQLEYKDVAGIFYNRCTSCHHTNGGAPFSLMNYSSTLPETATIQNALNLGHMPPWPADTTYKRYVKEHIITQSEKNAILSWISSGALQGDTTLAPPQPIYSQYKLTPPPDLVLQIPTFTSNATMSTDAYNIFALASGLTSDRIIRAIEIVPGNGSIVHHVVVTGDSTASSSSDLSGNAFTITGNIAIGGYQPGAEPVVFPNATTLKMGIRIKAGSQMLLQMHYPAGSGGQLDSTQIRLYFYPVGTTGVRQVYTMVPLQNWNYWVLPETTKTVTVDTAYLDWFPISLFSSLPHSHKVCSNVINYAYANTAITLGAPDTIPLVRINEWEFHWQYYYYFRNLVKIPPGYRYKGQHTYDNTSGNPDNPYSPPQLIIPGVSTNDEMFFDSFQFMVYQPGDELINIDSLLSSDPLLTASINELTVAKPWIYSIAYPNPFAQTTTIQIVSSNNAISDYELKIVDASGKEVKASVQKKANAFDISRSGISAGIYFYTIILNGNGISTGKLIIQ